MHTQEPFKREAAARHQQYYCLVQRLVTPLACHYATTCATIKEAQMAYCGHVAGHCLRMWPQGGAVETVRGLQPWPSPPVVYCIQVLAIGGQLPDEPATWQVVFLRRSKNRWCCPTPCMHTALAHDILLRPTTCLLVQVPFQDSGPAWCFGALGVPVDCATRGGRGIGVWQGCMHRPANACAPVAEVAG